MADRKKRPTLSHYFWNLFSIIPNAYSLISGVFHKMKMEAYFTVKQVIILCLFAMMLACVLTATWVSLLGILFFALLKLQWIWYNAALMVMFLNGIFLIILFVLIHRTKGKIAFSETTRDIARRE